MCQNKGTDISKGCNILSVNSFKRDGAPLPELYKIGDRKIYLITEGMPE
jgi:hypothetical protein